MTKKLAEIYQLEPEDNVLLEISCAVYNAKNNDGVAIHLQCGGTTIVITDESDVDTLKQEYSRVVTGFHPTPHRIGPTASAPLFS